MLTDYERYQLEWMIEHGHSLKEFVRSIDSVFDSLSDKYDSDIMDSIDNLPDAYEIWERDYGFDGEIFSNEREFKEVDLPAMNIEMVADTTEMPAKAVELIKSLYVVEGAMAQDHGIDYLFDNIEILTASVRDMLNREAERGQWEGQYKSLIDKCEEMRGDEDWDCRDTDALVDGFARDIEREADAAFEVARIEGELAMHNAAYYNPETGDLIVSYLRDYVDPTVEVFSYTPGELLDEIAMQGGDLEKLTVHGITADGDNSHHVATYHSTDELAESGIFGKGNLMDVSGEISFAEMILKLKADHAVDVKRNLENGGAYYNPERGIVIASFLLEQTSPRIEAYYGYTPYALASLIGRNANVTVNSDVMDIQDILADPSLPRRFDHEGASFDSVEELIASRWSPIGAGWLDMSGHDGLASAMGALGIKQTDNVREWYTLAFPGDELAVAINPSLTFDDTLAAVPTGDGFYTALGDAADSLLRERIFEELCNRYGYTYDEVYDSWLHESPLPSPAISQQPEKIAVAAGYRFNFVDAREASGIDLKGCGTVVTVDGHDYEIMKGATYEDSRKVDDLLDSHGDKPISAYRKQPQGMSLKQAVREAREASAKLTEKNGGTEDPTGKDER